jgi:hypothetical protein
MNLRVPQNEGNFLTRWMTISFSRRTLLHGITQLRTCSPFRRPQHSRDGGATGQIFIRGRRLLLPSLQRSDGILLHGPVFDQRHRHSCTSAPLWSDRGRRCNFTDCSFFCVQQLQCYEHYGAPAPRWGGIGGGRHHQQDITHQFVVTYNIPFSDRNGVWFGVHIVRQKGTHTYTKFVRWFLNEYMYYENNTTVTKLVRFVESVRSQNEVKNLYRLSLYLH